MRRTRCRAVICTLATILAFLLLVFLGLSAVEHNWLCAPWDEYLHALDDSADTNFLLLLGSEDSGVSMTLAKGPRAPNPDVAMAVHGTPASPHLASRV
jgi:hypothetical protein